MSALRATLHEPGSPRPNPTGNGCCSARPSAPSSRHHGALSAPAGTFLAPRSVEAADNALRQFARWLVAETDVTVVAGHHPDSHRGLQGVVGRPPWDQERHLAKNTQRHRLRMIRIFFERLIEWDWIDAPAAQPASSTATSRPGPIRCPSSSTTRTPPS